jgi:hypothetical protein
MRGFSYFLDDETQIRPLERARVSDAALGAALSLRSSEDLRSEAKEHEKRASELKIDAAGHALFGAFIAFVGTSLGPEGALFTERYAKGEAVLATGDLLKAQEEDEIARQYNDQATEAEKREQEARRQQQQQDHADSEKLDTAIRDTGDHVHEGHAFDYHDVPSGDDGHTYA